MSEDLVRCESCHGKKSILGMGGIQKECPNCFGIGWQTNKTKIEAERPILNSASSPFTEPYVHYEMGSGNLPPLVANLPLVSNDEHIIPMIDPVSIKKRGRPKKVST